MEASSSTLQEQIAFSLSYKEGRGQVFAWVEDQGRIFYSQMPVDYVGPATAVTQLIQYLFDLKRDHSFFILRKRIFTTSALTPLCRGMIKIAAKRATGEIHPQDHGIVLNKEWVRLGTLSEPLLQSQHVQKIPWTPPILISNQQQAQRALQDLMSLIPRGPVLHDHNREIAILICDVAGKVLEYATNSNFINKTMHAEVMAIQSYYRRTQKTLPENTTIYLSLKPCVMCAAIISRLAPDSCRVIYFQDDLGPLARNTELESRGMLYEHQ